MYRKSTKKQVNPGQVGKKSNVQGGVRAEPEDLRETLMDSGRGHAATRPSYGSN